MPNEEHEKMNQEIHKAMKQGHVQMVHNVKQINDMDKGEAAAVEQAEYDNINKVNHLPFADQRSKLVMYQNRGQFGTNYGKYHQGTHINETNARFAENNSLNKEYKDRIL